MAPNNLQQTGTVRWGFAFLSFSCMLLGMAAHGGYNHVTGIAQWSWPSFYAPIFVSPMVFGAFLWLIKSEIDMLTGSIISFQNGFFWKQIFLGLNPVLQAPAGS